MNENAESAQDTNETIALKKILRVRKIGTKQTK